LTSRIYPTGRRPKAIRFALWKIDGLPTGKGIELFQVAVFGTMALLGLRGSGM
jgi:hypothetical protein